MEAETMEAETISVSNVPLPEPCVKPIYVPPAVCLLPYMCRQEMMVHIPKKIKDRDTINQMVTEGVQCQYPNHKIYVISVRCTEDILYKLENKITSENIIDQKEYNYHIIYLIIPKELVVKFKSNNISSVAFYVGKSTNQSEYKILDKAPILDMISVQNQNGQNLPFAFTVNIL
jgi:hypothetical protein